METATQQAETVEAKPKIGRPTDYKPEFCEAVLKLGAEGYSNAEMAAHFGVAKQTFSQWKGVHPAFADAVTRADALAQAWWEARAREGVTDGKFNANLFKIISHNRWRDDYSDRKEVSIEANHLIHHSVLQSLAAPQVIDGEAEEVEFQGDE